MPVLFIHLYNRSGTQGDNLNQQLLDTKGFFTFVRTTLSHEVLFWRCEVPSLPDWQTASGAKWFKRTLAKNVDKAVEVCSHMYPVCVLYILV